MNVSPHDWAVVAVSTAIAAFASAQIPKIWRNQTIFGDRSPGWWLWGDALWRGWRRAFIAGIIAGWILILIGLTGDVLTATGLIAPPAPLWFTVPALVLFFGAVGLTVSIMLFNWPKFLVPPDLRREPGATQEWLANRGREPKANG